MDERFRAAFSDSVNELSDRRPYDRVFPVIDEVSKEILGERFSLREDGKLFLCVNLVSLVVIPWERAEKQDFFASDQNRSLLRTDLGNIISLARASAELEDRSDISANALFQATAFFNEGVTVRGLKMWGPDADD